MYVEVAHRSDAFTCTRYADVLY